MKFLTLKWGLERLAILLILLAGFGLRLWHLGQPELWFDETASTFIAQKNVIDIIHYSANAIREHPPFYYILLHFWMALTGESEFAIRFFSVIINLLFTSMLARLAYRFGGMPLAITTLAIAIIAPFSIFHAQEARMYNLVMCFGTGLIWATDGMLNSRRVAYALFFLIAVIGMATSYFFAPLILAADLILLWYRPGLIRQTRWWRTLMVMHLLALVGIGLLFTLPGPYSTLTSLLKITGGVLSWPSQIAVALQDIAGGRIEDSPFNLSIVLIMWSFVLLGAWHYARVRRLPLFLFLLATFGLAAILPVLDGRYLSAALPVVYLWQAGGIVWLWQKSPRIAWLALPLLLWTVAYPLQRQYQRDSGYFGAALARASSVIRGPQDTLVLAEPDAWPLVDFYSRGLPNTSLFYIPAHDTTNVSPAEVNERLGSILNQFERVVLGPVGAKNRDPEFLLEHYLLEHAFAASREFWPDSTMVAVFVAEPALHAASDLLDFGSMVRLQKSELSELQVPAGSQIAARLRWMSLTSPLPRFTVGLQLQDEDGIVWAKQQTEPCNGWCASPTWQSDEIMTDNRALLIPSDTPPGSYSLILRLDTTTAPLGEPQHLGSVELTPNTTLTPLDEPMATLGSIEVRQLAISPLLLRAGDELTWTAQWTPSVETEAGWQVVWELLMDETVLQRWQLSPSPVAFASQSWQAGQPMRGQGRLPLLGHLAAGKYDLRLKVIDADGKALDAPLWITSLTIVERPRRSSLPELGTPLDVSWAQGIYLRAYEIPKTAVAGQTLSTTLVWQAEGPTDRSYKIFLHLRDQSNQIVAQHDYLPANGGALTTTWVPNEVVVDEIALSLPADLTPGTYHLIVGFYDEATGERLKLSKSGDELMLMDIELIKK